jgi:hypothetical protein
MKTKGFSIGIIFLVLMVCTTCTKDEALLTPDGEPSALKSAQVNHGEEINYLLSLIEDIESMVEEGSLNKGNGNALIVKIKNAIKSHKNCNTTAASNQLGALINQLEAYVKSGILTEGQGELLITKVENGIVLLNPLVNTTWDFIISYSETSFWHADVTFYADGTTRYDEPATPGLYLTFGTWSMECNVLYYILEPSWPNHYHFTGTLSGNTMSGTWTWGDELKPWTATLK